MSKYYSTDYIEIDKLFLDVNNPRFAELYNGSDNEDELIHYLLYNESGIDIAKAIIEENEFYEDRSLWVISKDGGYLVKDGNRRCAAVKALQDPGRYGLELTSFAISHLPVLLYHNESDIEKRIIREHSNNSLFRSRGRMAKALEVFRYFNDGGTEETLLSFDGKRSDLVKLASFYFEAVKIGGEDLKKLLRQGKGHTGGKVIIFERLFSDHSKECGYEFTDNKKAKKYQINIIDEVKFKSFIGSIIRYLKENPQTTHINLDNDKKNHGSWLHNLKPYGFDYKDTAGSSGSLLDYDTNDTSSGNDTDGEKGLPPKVDKQSTDNEDKNKNESSAEDKTKNTSSANSPRGSTKKYPKMLRKNLPPGIKKLITECYDLDSEKYPNAKMAIVRVTFECVLKYIIDETKKTNGKFLKTSTCFEDALPGTNRKRTNFEKLKTTFQNLIKIAAIKTAFQNFELDKMNFSMHNYNINPTPVEGKTMCDNLMPLIEFMLQDEKDLLDALDQTKL